MNGQYWIKKINAYERLMRLDKPIGILLLLWPTLWALWIASEGKPDGTIVLLFVTGTVLMRSAGCVMNDLADRNFDGSVERTRLRPLATGEVTAAESLALAIVLVLLAFLLVLFLNKLTIMLSFAALFLAATYPFTKRFLAVPQAYLGMAFGFGIPMAFAAITGSVTMIAWLLLAASVCWSLAYDTAYAMVDREDDLKIGIRSSAIFFGKHDIAAIMGCYLLMLGLLGYVGFQLGFREGYFGGLTVAVFLAVHQYWLIRGRDRAGCFKAFLISHWVGCAVFAGLLVEYWLSGTY